jgi:hypothetical protein
MSPQPVRPADWGNVIALTLVLLLFRMISLSITCVSASYFNPAAAPPPSPIHVVIATLSSSSSPLTIAFGLVICSSTARHTPLTLLHTSFLLLTKPIFLSFSQSCRRSLPLLLHPCPRHHLHPRFHHACCSLCNRSRDFPRPISSPPPAFSRVRRKHFHRRRTRSRHAAAVLASRACKLVCDAVALLRAAVAVAASLRFGQKTRKFFRVTASRFHHIFISICRNRNRVRRQSSECLTLQRRRHVSAISAADHERNSGAVVFNGCRRRLSRAAFSVCIQSIAQCCAILCLIRFCCSYSTGCIEALSSNVALPPDLLPQQESRRFYSIYRTITTCVLSSELVNAYAHPGTHSSILRAVTSSHALSHAGTSPSTPACVRTDTLGSTTSCGRRGSVSPSIHAPPISRLWLSPSDSCS